jgi:hypothetical protein
MFDDFLNPAQRKSTWTYPHHPEIYGKMPWFPGRVTGLGGRFAMFRHTFSSKFQGKQFTLAGCKMGN